MKTNKVSPSSLIRIALSVAALSSTATAGTITWGGGQLSTNYSSNGSSLELGTDGSGPVTFQIGIFQNKTTGASFSPTLANAAQWADNWVPFGPASGGEPFTGSESDYINPVDGAATALNQNYFTGAVKVGVGADKVNTFAEGSNTAPATEVTEGRQVYVWGYNSQTPSQNTEWVLFTGETAGDVVTNENWKIPVAAEVSNDSYERQWDVASANQAVVGNIPGSIGAGEKTDETLTGISDIQFATVIPEPSSALLSTLGLLALMRRRRQG